MGTSAAGGTESSSGTRLRRLGLFTVLCIGVNNIVGAGIFRKPSQLAHYLADASWLGFAADGLMLVTVALCFSTMAARTEETGGPYVYARRAFGPWIAFVVAWTAWISMWAAAAAVTTTLPEQLDLFFPGARAPGIALAIGLATLALFCLLNCIGLKPAAGAATFLTVAKVVPLAVFIAVGLFHVDGARVGVGTEWNAATSRAFGSALFAAFYPLQGFEVVPVPAGELRNPRRDVPLAVTGALVASALLYCLIQGVAFAAAPQIALRVEGEGELARIVGPVVGPDRDALLAAAGWDRLEREAQLDAVAIASSRPLAEAARAFLGDFGGMLLSAGACISFLGFTAVTILCAPRFLVALARDGLLPAAFGRMHPRFGTPTLAVIATCGVAAVGALVAGLGGAAQERFDRLTALSNVAVLVQYAATCAAVLRLPGGAAAGAGRRHLARRLLPIAGLCVSGFLGFLIWLEPNRLEQLLGFLGWTAAGLLLALVARRRGERDAARRR